MILIDTHTHLYDDSFTEDLDQVIEKARQVGVQKMLMPNCDWETFPKMMEVYQRYPTECWPMLGLHPCYVKENFEAELQALYAQKDAAPYIAIGEIGLDYYWDKTFIQEQKEAFKMQIQWAKEMHLPIVIHTRDSLDDGIQVVHDSLDNQLKGVFHCFSGDKAQAMKIIEMGFKLGIGGVLTFKNSSLKDWLKDIDIQHIVIETDAPYLAPVPYRGKRNESAYVAHVAEFLATIYQRSAEEVAEITTQNAQELFNFK